MLFPVVPEALESRSYAGQEIDSLAVHGGEVYVTAKTGDRLIVVADLREMLRPGSAAGEMHRPNGIAVIGDLAFVVERNNHRLQVLAWPSGETRAIIGADLLRRPYGIAAYESSPGVIQVYVTDNHHVASADDLARHFEFAGRRGKGSPRPPLR